MYKIGCIGVGKIASAVITALSTTKNSNAAIFISPRNEQNSIALATQFEQVHRMQSNQEVIDASDIVCIALRPNDALAVLKTLKFRVDQRVVSFIPYLYMNTLQEVVHPVEQITRAIPLPTVVTHNCPIPLFNATEELTALFSHIGQPLAIQTEEELHAIWTLTGLITPIYELMDHLESWTASQGISTAVSTKYVADLFESLAYTAQQSDVIDFKALANHAATPNGMNEQAGKEIKANGAHQAFVTASDNLLANFTKKVL